MALGAELVHEPVDGAEVPVPGLHDSDDDLAEEAAAAAPGHAAVAGSNAGPAAAPAAGPQAVSTTIRINSLAGVLLCSYTVTDNSETIYDLKKYLEQDQGIAAVEQDLVAGHEMANNSRKLVDLVSATGGVLDLTLIRFQAWEALDLRGHPERWPEFIGRAVRKLTVDSRVMYGEVTVWVQQLARLLPESLGDFTLNLSRTEVGNADAQALGAGLPRYLQELVLNLSETQVGDPGVQALGAGLPPGLRHLELILFGIQVGDPGVQALGAGLPPGLQQLKLDLNNTRVGNPGVQALGAGLPPGLQHLDLRLIGTQVREGSVEELVDQLPGKLRTLCLLMPTEICHIVKRVKQKAKERLPNVIEIIML